MENEPEFLKDLPRRPDRRVLTIQILAVPFLILAIAVGIFVFFSALTREDAPLSLLLERMQSSGGHQRAVYANDFVRRLRAERGDPAKEPSPEIRALVRPILDMLEDLQQQRQKAEERRPDPSLLQAMVDASRLLVNALGIIRDPDSAPELVKFLRAEKDEAVFADVLNVLGALRSPESAEALREATRHASLFVRKHAVFNLAALRRAEHRDELREFLTDAQREIRWNAAFGLAYFLGDAAGAPVLRGMVGDSLAGRLIASTEERFVELREHAVSMAVKGLAAVRDREALPLLERLAKEDPSPHVRMLAREAQRAIAGD